MVTHEVSNRTEQDAISTARSVEIAVGAMPVGISWADISDQKIVFMNRKFTEIFGYVVGDFETITDWIAHYPFEEDRVRATERWGAYFAAPDRFEFAIEPMELRVRCKDGTVMTVLHGGIVLPEIGRGLAYFVDITDRKRDELLLRAAERQARETQAMLLLVLDHSPEMIVLSSFDESRRFVSAAVMQITGLTPQEYLSVKWEERTHPDDRERIASVIGMIQGGKPSHVFRYRTTHKDGGYRWVEAALISYTDPLSKQVAGYVATVRDISEQMEQEKISAAVQLQLMEAASLDELTGIANRRAFNQTLQKESVRQTRSVRELSLLLIDVDYFKQYNDLYGHLQGDECLKRIAQTLRQSLLREADLAARFGGEEFVIILPMTEGDGAAMVAHKILQAISALTIPHKGSPYGIITVSIGGATCPPGAPFDKSTLLERSDQALYAAKNGGRNAFVASSFGAATNEAPHEDGLLG